MDFVSHFHVQVGVRDTHGVKWDGGVVWCGVVRYEMLYFEFSGETAISLSFDRVWASRVSNSFSLVLANNCPIFYVEVSRVVLKLDSYYLLKLM